MRFVLSFIVSSFFFFSPFQGKASSLLAKQLKTNIDNCNATTLPDYSISDDYAVANINSNHRNSSTTHKRFYPFNNFIVTIAFQNGVNFFYEEKLFVQPHLITHFIKFRSFRPGKVFPREILQMSINKG